MIIIRKQSCCQTREAYNTLVDSDRAKDTLVVSLNTALFVSASQWGVSIIDIVAAKLLLMSSYQNDFSYCKVVCLSNLLT